MTIDTFYREEDKNLCLVNYSIDDLSIGEDLFNRWDIDPDDPPCPDAMLQLVVDTAALRREVDNIRAMARAVDTGAQRVALHFDCFDKVIKGIWVNSYEDSTPAESIEELMKCPGSYLAGMNGDVHLELYGSARLPEVDVTMCVTLGHYFDEAQQIVANNCVSTILD